ncbi:MAG: glutamine--fructose-6-phosphate transaminase (isomerizing) [Desulfomonile tiedjei]|uniref:Glutamine--fructose-6-phosphate aminotransferase [isomerizing] n=1 Tax=Desulfomonile tiedjei TaxID=2358 RepID=A0A9D6UY24_9BACT|nr:glutamine--fructose-6-phosphate transaminase (isomerizing) [Desulfomonile tiedjei]
MCGIVGYVGNSLAWNILLGGLKKLEYRGYDSAGMAVIHEGRLNITRVNGKICALGECLETDPLPGVIGIGHTRWATHGKPCTVNAHPHRAGRVAVVHNGIIENYMDLKNSLTSSGSCFQSETDTEVIAQLLNHHLDLGAEPLDAIQQSCKTLRGSFAAGILIEDDPENLYAIRKESPLIIGIGEGETFLASDAPAILAHTSRMIFMDDGQIAVLNRRGVLLRDFNGTAVKKTVRKMTISPSMAEKGGWKHFMIKEIFEQPRAVADTFRGRICEETGAISLDGLKLTDREAKEVERIVIVACGTSYHAGLVARRMIEDLTRIPVEVDIASEFRYRDPIIGPNTLLISISQSGETADTLAATREAAMRGAKVISVCNVIESSLARSSSHGVIYTQAGPEIGVASTKAFTTQIATLYLFAIYMAWKRDSINSEKRLQLVKDLVHLPGLMTEALAASNKIAELAEYLERFPNFLYLGRGIDTAIAYEGALKLKEISYIHAEAYAGGEMKHGPIALISEEMPVVVILSPNHVYEKMLGNIQEVRSRGGIVVAVCAGEEDPKVAGLAQAIIRVPASNQYLTSIQLTLPLQLLAYYVADLKGTDVDQPRNLAKSVTVE